MPLPATPAPGAIVALDNVDLEIGTGQSVAVIGNNGAGKSTLLRLIAGTTSPSRGEVAVHGRVSSMIELGLGFHPEMTGAENLRFGAGLLGMDRAALKERWTEIVEFSGIAHALEQPVKHYSTGMRARLGFSLASHCEADIILIDEVLSVGDFDFQHRSLERLVQMHDEGRTTIFATHNLHSLPALCQRVVRLDAGWVVADGAPEEVIPEYVANEERKLEAGRELPVTVEHVEVEPGTVLPSESITIRGTVRIREPLPGCRLVVRIGFGAALLAWAGSGFLQPLDRLSDEPLDIELARGPGAWQVDVTVRSFPFFPGEYAVGLAVIGEGMHEITRHVVPLTVEGKPDEWKSVHLSLDQRNTPLGES